jgi:hypothetical protein
VRQDIIGDVVRGLFRQRRSLGWTRSGVIDTIRAFRTIVGTGMDTLFSAVTQPFGSPPPRRARLPTAFQIYGSPNAVRLDGLDAVAGWPVLRELRLVGCSLSETDRDSLAALPRRVSVQLVKA